MNPSNPFAPPQLRKDEAESTPPAQTPDRAPTYGLKVLKEARKSQPPSINDHRLAARAVAWICGVPIQPAAGQNTSDAGPTSVERIRVKPERNQHPVKTVMEALKQSFGTQLASSREHLRACQAAISRTVLNVSPADADQAMATSSCPILQHEALPKAISEPRVVTTQSTYRCTGEFQSNIRNLLFNSRGTVDTYMVPAFKLVSEALKNQRFMAHTLFRPEMEYTPDEALDARGIVIYARVVQYSFEVPLVWGAGAPPVSVTLQPLSEPRITFYPFREDAKSARVVDELYSLGHDRIVEELLRCNGPASLMKFAHSTQSDPLLYNLVSDALSYYLPNIQTGRNTESLYGSLCEDRLSWWDGPMGGMTRQQIQDKLTFIRAKCTALGLLSGDLPFLQPRQRGEGSEESVWKADPGSVEGRDQQLFKVARETAGSAVAAWLLPEAKSAVDIGSKDAKVWSTYAKSSVGAGEPSCERVFTTLEPLFGSLQDGRLPPQYTREGGPELLRYYIFLFLVNARTSLNLALTPTAISRSQNEDEQQDLFVAVMNLPLDKAREAKSLSPDLYKLLEVEMKSLNLGLLMVNPPAPETEPQPPLFPRLRGRPPHLGGQEPEGLHCSYCRRAFALLNPQLAQVLFVKDPTLILDSILRIHHRHHSHSSHEATTTCYVHVRCAEVTLYSRGQGDGMQELMCKCHEERGCRRGRPRPGADSVACAYLGKPPQKAVRSINNSIQGIAREQQIAKPKVVTKPKRRAGQGTSGLPAKKAKGASRQHK